MSSITIPILLWIFLVELPLSLIKFRSSQKVLEKTKQCVLSIHPHVINIETFLAQHSALASDTIFYKYSFRKASHIGMIVALTYFMTLNPWVLIFLFFAILGFIQDWEEVRKEQYRLVEKIPPASSPNKPAGIALSDLRAQRTI